MDQHLLDGYVAYALDLVDVIEACRARRNEALCLDDLKRAALEERTRNRHINQLEQVFADVRKLHKKAAATKK
jgi:hypothetical protein